MLSKKAQYAFRALSILAKNFGNGPLPISSIVKEYPMSIKFLETILLELRKSGVLGSRKGKGGGYYLLNSPENISLAKVIRILEPSQMEIFSNEDGKDSSLNQIMTEAIDSKIKVLEKKTLADLIQ